MGRVSLIILVVALHVSAMLWLFTETVSPAVALAEEEVPMPDSIELELLEMGGATSASAHTLGDFEASANLTDVHIMPNYATVSDLIPRVVISKSAETLGGGYYFLANFGVGSGLNHYTLLIINDQAQLVYYKPSPGNRLLDFRRQPDGTLAYHDSEVGGYKVLDKSYQLANTWLPGNGYAVADHHDLQILSNGNVVFLIYDTQPVDLTAYGGRADAQVVDLVIQEMDQDHNVVFEWNSRDHFAITDTYVSLDQAVVDYAHGNAIEEDIDGNFLISNRHLSEITKIDRLTGEIIWRLGGKNNEFTFINDEVLPGVGTFSYQHDIRRLPNGHITIFDNGNQFMDAGLRGSRGIEYEIDEVNKTVTLVKEFRTIPDTYSGFMGSMQRLQNGNAVIGWGGGIPPKNNQPIAITEFTPEGDVALELAFRDDLQLSYRGLKFPWQGFPTTDPLLMAVTDTVTPTLYYSWNGATEVLSYTVYGGETPDSLNTVAQQPKTDFEDSTPLDSIQSSLCFFQVIPSMKPNVEARASNVLYLGDASCGNGLSASNSEVASRSFTYPQSGGNVTTTLNILPDGVTSPTIFIQSPYTVGVASVPAGQFMSSVRFGLQAYQGEELNEISTLTTEVRLAIDYGALDLSRGPADVSLLRWNETTQSWTNEGLALLQREVVGQRVTYALHRTGEFALFVANEVPQSTSVSTLINEDESFSFSADLFPYFDSDGDTFAGLLVETLPVSGLLSYRGSPLVPFQVITPATLSSLTFTPETDEFGLPYTSFSYRVSDSFTQSVPYSLTIAVAPVNDEPVATDDDVLDVGASAASPASEQVFTISIPVLANDYDVDGDRLRIASITNPAYGTAESSGDLIVYTSSRPYAGTDSFTYTIDDGHGGQDTATVSVVRSANVQYLPRIEQ